MRCLHVLHSERVKLATECGRCCPCLDRRAASPHASAMTMQRQAYAGDPSHEKVVDAPLAIFPKFSKLVSVRGGYFHGRVTLGWGCFFPKATFWGVATFLNSETDFKTFVFCFFGGSKLFFATFSFLESVFFFPAVVRKLLVVNFPRQVVRMLLVVALFCRGLGVGRLLLFNRSGSDSHRRTVDTRFSTNLSRKCDFAI